MEESSQIDKSTYARCREQIRMTLRAHEPADRDLLAKYMDNQSRSVLSATLERMLADQEIEIHQDGQASTSYYRLKKPPYWQEKEFIESLLGEAQEELLGLHRKGAMTYDEYTSIADLLVEAEERLGKRLRQIQEERKQQPNAKES